MHPDLLRRCTRKPGSNPRLGQNKRRRRTLVKTIGDKDVAQRLLSQGMEPVLNTPEQFAERIREDLPRWGKLVRAAGIKAE